VTKQHTDELLGILRAATAELPAVSFAIGPQQTVPISRSAPDPVVIPRAAPVPSGIGAWLRQLTHLIRSEPPSPTNGLVAEIIEITDRAANDQEGQDVPTETGTESQADSYGISLPRGWIEQPLDPAAFERALTDQKGQLKAQQINRTDIRKFEFLQRQIHDQLVTENVQYVATLAGRGPSAADGSEPAADNTLLLAGLVITSRTRAALGAPGAITTAMLLRSFGGSTDAEQGINIEEPTEIELAAGKAFRLVRFHSQALATGDRPERIEYYEHAYLVPHDDGQRLAFVQMVTPSLGFSEPLGELFDAIAATLRIFYPGDPTTFDPPASAGLK
jgi:hypothetical protein